MTWHSKAGWSILGGALGVALVGMGCRNAPPPKGMPEVAVQVIHPERVVLTTELPGRTLPYLVAEIRPQVNGLILKRLFEEGSDVKAGSILYQIDPAPYQAALDQASAALAMAESNLPVGQQEADDAQAALQQAQASVAAARAAVASARINLSHTPIASPIPGRAGISSVTVGALVTAYQPAALVTVQQLDPIYVDVTQSSADQLRLRRRLEGGRIKGGGDGARKVKLLLEDGTTYPLEGTLKFRDVTVDPTTGTTTLRLVFPNPQHVLLPNMFVRAVVEEGVNDQAILAMQQGVTRDPRGNPIAWVLDRSDKVEQRTLTVEKAIGDRWLVTGGLAEGDRLPASHLVV
jgi:membrane fusion protein (multidrug efflux system)